MMLLSRNQIINTAERWKEERESLVDLLLSFLGPILQALAAEESRPGQVLAARDWPQAALNISISINHGILSHPIRLSCSELGT